MPQSLPPPLPLTVIGGYLGAGKTTLVNRLLSRPEGVRMTVLVNDFGAINIDAALIAAAGADTIALTNGCVCCTMGADLFMAIGRVLDAPDRPDRLVIEASGVADPAAIANVAVAEPDLAPGGIVTVVDAGEYPRLADDPLIGAQLQRQVAVADLLAVSKVDAIAPALSARLAADGPAPQVLASDVSASLLLAEPGARPQTSGLAAEAAHPAHVSWSCPGPVAMERAALARLLARRPAGLYRVKGWASTPEGVVEVQAVGRQVAITPAPDARQTALVGIGLAGLVSPAEIELWWAGAD